MTDALVFSDALKSFLSEVFPAVVASKRPDGSIHMNPIWFEYEDGYIWLNSARGRKWVERVQREGTITLLFVDPKDMFRTAEVRGTIVSVTEDGAVEHIHHVSHRYLGKDYPWMGDDVRVKVQVQPTKVHTSFD